MEKMSATTMKSILGENAVITFEQGQVLSDFEIVKSLDLFPKEMWSDVDDIEISHFGKWCHQVLTFEIFQFFHVDVNDDDHIREVLSLKFRFRHLYNRVSVLRAEDTYPLNMDYPEFKWNTPASITPEAAQFRKQFADTFRIGSGFNNRPTPAVASEPEVNTPTKVKKESAVKKSQKHKLMTKNARRSTSGNLVSGYTKMPKDNAIFQPFSNTFTPTIIVNSVESSTALDEKYPADERDNGFMVKCFGETVYWNVEKQDFQKDPI